MLPPNAVAAARAEPRALAEQHEKLPRGNVRLHAEQLVAMAQMIGELRRRRGKFLAPELFAEPGWEMLLALYSTEAAGLRMSVSNLCRMSEGPQTTAVRWIERLEALRMISRVKSMHDGRVFFVELTPDARARIEDYLAETWVSMFGEN
jgi:DNA-binding MarR family transcriptional regulator